MQTTFSLHPQEVILGLFGEYVALDAKAWSGGLVNVLGDLGFSGPAARIALTRVVKRGLLKPSKTGRFVWYAITPRLHAVHEEGRRQTFSRSADPSWDGKWTLVWYSIPEEHRSMRSRLGRWLNFRGFGGLQDGTWIAPGDCASEVLPLIKQLKLEKHIILSVVPAGQTFDIRSVINRAWDLRALAGMYQEFVSEFSDYSSRTKLKSLSTRDAFVLRTRLIEMFRQTASHDVQLPDAILGVRWLRREAISLFLDLQKMLSERAFKYFHQEVLDRFSA